jgi:hypothetical protein
MTIPSFVLASLLGVAVCIAAQEQRPDPIACNLKAIRAAERPRYNDLMKRASRGRSELSEGYVFKLDAALISLPEVAEWMTLERLCCPFLTFQLATSGKQGDWLLTLTGPTGVKLLLEAEFPQH